MVLTKEKISQIAIRMLKEKIGENGLSLNPKSIKRDIHNEAKKLGVSTQEMAEFAKLIYQSAFDETMAELESISPSAKVAVNEDNT